MTEIPTLADKTIVERKGDDVTERHVGAVLDHPVAEKIEEKIAKETGPKHYVHNAPTIVIKSDVVPPTAGLDPSGADIVSGDADTPATEGKP